MGTYTYDDIVGTVFRLVNRADCYQYDSQYIGMDRQIAAIKAYMQNLVENGEKLTIVGVVAAFGWDASASALSPGINYPASLTEHVARICGGLGDRKRTIGLNLPSMYSQERNSERKVQRTDLTQSLFLQ